jgi:hypothetical protein
MQERQKRDLERLEQNERNTRILQLQHSVSWLDVDEKVQDTALERISRRRHDKTCEWIFLDPQMRAWLEGDNRHRLLWINGKPGAGMS